MIDMIDNRKLWRRASEDRFSEPVCRSSMCGFCERNYGGTAPPELISDGFPTVFRSPAQGAADLSHPPELSTSVNATRVFIFTGAYLSGHGILMIAGAKMRDEQGWWWEHGAARAGGRCHLSRRREALRIELGECKADRPRRLILAREARVLRLRRATDGGLAGMGRWGR
jgi:hypothetical protein